jgi:elongation factor Ts
MANITASDVAKLRQMTGAGMMDCKQALTESDGDFEVAVDILRKKGQKVAGKRADREAREGAVLAKVSADRKFAVLTVLNCETDFVAKNEDFVKFARFIIDTAIEKRPANIDELKALPFNKITIADEIMNQTGVIGEKIDLSVYEFIKAEDSVAYIHPGNKLASIAGFSKKVADEQTAKDVVMQIASMAPIAVDKEQVSQKVIDKEIEIGKELAIQEGKPADMAEKIAQGRLGKFFKESTLNNQQFIKDNKITVKEYLVSKDKDLKVTEFRRFTLNE